MKQRNGKIELMRFVFSLCILCFHVGETLWNGQLVVAEGVSFFALGTAGVEFFFVVSGFLLAQSLFSQLEKEKLGNILPPDNLGDATLQFLWRKLKSVLPYFWLFSGATIVFLCISRTDELPWLIIDRLPGLFLLGRTGIMGDTSTFLGADWYLSSMFLSMAILYPLCRRYGKTFSRLAAPLVGVLLLGYIMHVRETLGGQWSWNGFTYYFNLRAFAELALGIGGYEACTALSKCSFTWFQRLLLTVTEAVCYLVPLRYMCSFASYKYWGYIPLLLLVAVVISFSQKSFLAKSSLFQNRFCYFLGAISTSIYLDHRLVRDVVIYVLPELPKKRQCFLITLLTLMLSILVYAAVSTFQKRKSNVARV